MNKNNFFARKRWVPKGLRGMPAFYLGTGYLPQYDYYDSLPAGLLLHVLDSLGRTYRDYLREEHPEYSQLSEDERRNVDSSFWYWNMDNPIFDMTHVPTPEYIIYPSTADKKLAKEFRETFSNLPKETRNLFLQKLNSAGNSSVADNDMLKRLLEYHKEGNSPTVYSDNRVKERVRGWLGLTKDGTEIPGGRAYYRNSANTMYNISNFTDYMAELSHALQYNSPRFKKYSNAKWPEDGDTPNENGLTAYEDPEAGEYKAHKIIEPILWKDIMHW